MSLRFQQNLSLQKQQLEFEERAEKAQKLLYNISAPIEREWRWASNWHDPLSESLARIQHPNSKSNTNLSSKASNSNVAFNQLYGNLHRSVSSLSLNQQQPSNNLQGGVLSQSNASISNGNVGHLVSEPTASISERSINCRYSGYWTSPELVFCQSNEYYFPPGEAEIPFLKPNYTDNLLIYPLASVVPKDASSPPPSSSSGNLTDGSATPQPNKNYGGKPVQRFPYNRSNMQLIKSEAEREIMLRRVSAAGASASSRNSRHNFGSNSSLSNQNQQGNPEDINKNSWSAPGSPGLGNIFRRTGSFGPSTANPFLQAQQQNYQSPIGPDPGTSVSSSAGIGGAATSAMYKMYRKFRFGSSGSINTSAANNNPENNR